MGNFTLGVDWTSGFEAYEEPGNDISPRITSRLVAWDPVRLSRGLFPDLRRSPLLHNQEGFNAVVLEGILSGNGMAAFGDRLDEEDARALRAFLVEQAHQALAESSEEAPR